METQPMSLLDELVAFMKRFVVFADDHQPVALALWVIHTHALDAADTTPYPLITSPEKRSGKSRLLEVLDLLTARPWLVAGVSEPVLFRKIAKDTPTLLLDELDAIFGTYSEKSEPIRAVINSGSRRGGSVARCVGPNYDVKDFAVFCPKCLAGINTGRLPETIRDRSFPIGMKRRIDEPIEPFRWGRARQEAQTLVGRVARWAKEHVEPLREKTPAVPDELNDRAAEGWEPLLAIAEQLGSDVAERARRAAISLGGESEVEDDSLGVQLLADLKQIWENDESMGDNVFSSYLCSALKNLEDRPWAGWGKGRAEQGFTQRDLARMLRPYGIRSKTVRRDVSTGKGYQREQFEDAWKRYVPESSGDDEAGPDTD